MNTDCVDYLTIEQVYDSLTILISTVVVCWHADQKEYGFQPGQALGEVFDKDRICRDRGTINEKEPSLPYIQQTKRRKNEAILLSIN